MENILIISIGLLWVFVLFNLLLTFALIRRLSRSANASLPLNPYEGLDLLESLKPAPDFRAITLEGERVTLSTYAGRFVAFVFFNLGCQTCLSKISDIELLVPEAKSQGLEIVLVNTADTVEKVREFFKGLKVNLPVLLAPPSSSPFAKDYKVPGVPFFCVLSHESRVIWVGYFDERWDFVLSRMREGLLLKPEAFSTNELDGSHAEESEQPQKEAIMN